MLLPMIVRSSQSARFQQLFVQTCQIAGFRNRYQPVAAEPAQFPFHAAFSLPLAGLQYSLLNPSANGMRSRVRSPRADIRGVFSSPRLQVVVANGSEYTAEVAEAVLMSFEECLLRRIGIGPVKPVT